MRTTAHRLRRPFALATVISAIAVPAAAAAPVDPPILGAPDEPQQSQPSQSQRESYPGSLDAQVATTNTGAQPSNTGAQPSQRDYPRGVDALAPPESTPVTVQVEPRTVAGDGFDWGDAGIGASAVLALAAIAGGAAIALGHSSRRGHKLA